MGVIKMMNLEFYRNLPKKECRECGCEIKEQHESYLYECEHCMRTQEE
jgi:CO dehydrogenase/acetyl-CoA synthase gamma subunit (corrinoid Fe-S protein)